MGRTLDGQPFYAPGYRPPELEPKERAALDEKLERMKLEAQTAMKKVRRHNGPQVTGTPHYEAGNDGCGELNKRRKLMCLKRLRPGIDWENL